MTLRVRKGYTRNQSSYRVKSCRCKCRLCSVKTVNIQIIFCIYFFDRYQRRALEIGRSLLLQYCNVVLDLLKSRGVLRNFVLIAKRIYPMWINTAVSLPKSRIIFKTNILTPNSTATACAFPPGTCAKPWPTRSPASGRPWAPWPRSRARRHGKRSYLSACRAGEVSVTYLLQLLCCGWRENGKPASVEDAVDNTDWRGLRRAASVSARARWRRRSPSSRDRRCC